MFVLLEMLSQFPDAFGKECDLDLGRTSVLLVLAKLLDRLRFRLGVQYDLFRAGAVRKWGIETICRVPPRQRTLFLTR